MLIEKVVVCVRNKLPMENNTVISTEDLNRVHHFLVKLNIQVDRFPGVDEGAHAFDLATCATR